MSRRMVDANGREHDEQTVPSEPWALTHNCRSQRCKPVVSERPSESQDVGAISRFANRIAKYVATARTGEPWLPHRWMVEAVTVTLTDPGAATEALALVPRSALLDALREEHPDEVLAALTEWGVLHEVHAEEITDGSATFVLLSAPVGTRAFITPVADAEWARRALDEEPTDGA